jgi:hypothetical protein
MISFKEAQAGQRDESASRLVIARSGSGDRCEGACLACRTLAQPVTITVAR